MFVDWSLDSIDLTLLDIDNRLGASNPDAVLMNLQFNDARSANVTIGDYSGTAELVTTELVAKSPPLGFGDGRALKPSSR